MLPGAAPGGRERDSARQAPRQALANHASNRKARRGPDLVQRDLTASRPDELWVGGLLLSVLLGGRRVFQIDACSRKGRRLTVRGQTSTAERQVSPRTAPPRKAPSHDRKQS